MNLRLLALGAVLSAGVAWADRLPTQVVPERYELILTPDLASATFTGEETLHLRVDQPTAAVVLNAAELTFSEVTVNQGGKTSPAKVSLDPKSERVTFTTPAPLAKGPADLHVRYAGKLNGELRGFYLAKTEKRRYAVTQFENTDARRAFPCFDEPALKAVFDVTVIADQGDLALSNAPVHSDAPGPGPKKHTVHFEASPKMSSYLVAFAVGDFVCDEGSADGIPIRVCATPEGKGQLGFALKAAEQVIPFYDRYFGIKYPYGKIDYLAVPDFQAGAMENPGLVIARNFLLLSDADASYEAKKIIAQQAIDHETAHQWFGDLVTMKWWDDIWLNEGFATWMAFKPIAEWQPTWNIDADATQSLMGAMASDARETTHPIHQAADDPAQIRELFDEISYDKTAAILRMVEGYVGDEPFRQGVSAYLKRYAYGNAAAADFWGELTESTHQPVDEIMKSFVIQPGVPLISVTSRCVNGQSQVSLTQRRYFSDRKRFLAGSDEVWTVPVCLRGGKNVKCTLMTGKTATAELPGCAPIFANAGAQGYYVSGYEAANLAGLAKLARSKGPPEAISVRERTLLVGDARAGLTTGTLDAGAFLELIRALKDDPERPVVEAALGGVALMDELVSEAGHPALRKWVRDTYRPAAERLGLPRPGEAPELRARRSALWSLAGWIGRDPKIAAEAKALVQASLKGDPADETLLNSAVTIAAVNGDAALFDAFLERLGAPRNPEETYRYLHGLAAFEDPKLVQRAMDYGLSPKLRTQDGIFLWGAMLQNRVAQNQIWDFVSAHWKEVLAKMPEGHWTYFVGAFGAYCDPGKREQIARFLTENPVPSADRASHQALEGIDRCVALRSEQQSKLDAWLSGAAKAPRAK